MLWSRGVPIALHSAPGAHSHAIAQRTCSRLHNRFPPFSSCTGTPPPPTPHTPQGVGWVESSSPRKRMSKKEMSRGLYSVRRRFCWATDCSISEGAVMDAKGPPNPSQIPREVPHPASRTSLKKKSASHRVMQSGPLCAQTSEKG